MHLKSYQIHQVRERQSCCRNRLVQALGLRKAQGLDCSQNPQNRLELALVFRMQAQVLECQKYRLPLLELQSRL
jgi:hypothetical protein